LRVKKMTANSNSDSNDDLERFQTGAPKYAAYLETPEGRLRLDLAFANLQDFLPQAPGPLHLRRGSSQRPHRHGVSLVSLYDSLRTGDQVADIRKG
jgi:hypothetical protein